MLLNHYRRAKDIMDNLKLENFENEHEKTQFLNNQRRIKDFEVVNISTLKGYNRINYYYNLIKNLVKPQNIIVKNFKETSLVKVDYNTKQAWEKMLNIEPKEAKKVFVAYHSKFVFDSMMKALDHKGINFKNVMHLSTCINFIQDPLTIFANEFVEADFEIQSIKHFNHNRAVLKMKTTLFDIFGNKSSEQLDDVFVKNLSENDLKTIDAENVSYENKKVFTEKYVSTINEENASYTKTVHLGKKFGQKYGNVSGDLNPLHTSQMFAKVAGFKEPFIQGAFWVHFMLHQISKQHKITHLNVYMVKPALLGQDFKLYIKDDLFEIKNEQNKVVCRGDFS